MERPASQASPSDVPGVGGVGLRELWRLMNAAHPVNPGAARLACGVLLVAYLVLGVARHDAGHPEFDWVR